MCWRTSFVFIIYQFESGKWGDYREEQWLFLRGRSRRPPWHHQEPWGRSQSKAPLTNSTAPAHQSSFSATFSLSSFFPGNPYFFSQLLLQIQTKTIVYIFNNQMTMVRDGEGMCHVCMHVCGVAEQHGKNCRHANRSRTEKIKEDENQKWTRILGRKLWQFNEDNNVKNCHANRWSRTE